VSDRPEEGLAFEEGSRTMHAVGYVREDGRHHLEVELVSKEGLVSSGLRGSVKLGRGMGPNDRQ
jgi:hypothetical protein